MDTTSLGDLFDPVQLGRLQLRNRIVMAPLTRSRASANGVPTPMMADYYGQRASAGLIIAEGTNIAAQARGYAYTPGLYELAQIFGWQHVTHAVHHRGGHVFVQLWHVGRLSHPSLQPDTALPVAPSAIRARAQVFTGTGFQPCVMPRALGRDEIIRIVDQYTFAARNALAAGFDGVELHAANGYLIEQFLRESSNQRTDDYGGTLAHRVRFLLEVIESLIGVCGAQRVGVRLSPLNTVNDSTPDRDPYAACAYLVEQLNELKVGYIHMIEGVTPGQRETPAGFSFKNLRSLCRCTYIGNNGYDRQLVLQARQHRLLDLVSFGRLYISNPDLVERLRTDAVLTEPDPKTFFSGGARGYTDY